MKFYRNEGRVKKIWNFPEFNLDSGKLSKIIDMKMNLTRVLDPFGRCCNVQTPTTKYWTLFNIC